MSGPPRSSPWARGASRTRDASRRNCSFLQKSPAGAARFFHRSSQGGFTRWRNSLSHISLWVRHIRSVFGTGLINNNLIHRSERSHAFTRMRCIVALYRIRLHQNKYSDKCESRASTQVVVKENSVRLLKKFERVSSLWMLHQKVASQRSLLDFLIQIYRYCCHPSQAGCYEHLPESSVWLA